MGRKVHASHRNTFIFTLVCDLEMFSGRPTKLNNLYTYFKAKYSHLVFFAAVSVFIRWLVCQSAFELGFCSRCSHHITFRFFVFMSIVVGILVREGPP